MAICLKCGLDSHTTQTPFIKVKRATIGYGFLCSDCTEKQLDKSAANVSTSGTKKATGLRYKRSFPLSQVSNDIKGFFSSLGYIDKKSSNGVHVFESPYMNGINSLSKTLQSLDKQDGYTVLSYQSNFEIRHNLFKFDNDTITAVLKALNKAIIKDIDTSLQVFDKAYNNNFVTFQDGSFHFNLTQQDYEKDMITVRFCQQVATCILKRYAEPLQKFEWTQDERTKLNKKLSKMLVKKWDKLAASILM